MRTLKTALVVADDSPSSREAAEFLAREWGLAVRRVSRVEDALADLDDPPDILLLQASLAGGDALAVVRAAAQRRPAPLQVAFGVGASSRDAFALGQAGVHGFVACPFSLSRLATAIRDALGFTPELAPVIGTLVGQWSLREVQREVRHVMLAEAFARTRSRRGAAGILKISRQAVQQALAADETLDIERAAGH